MTWWVYIIKCNDDSFYTGISPTVEKRVWKHNNKRGSKYVRSKLPAILVYKEAHEDKIKAAKREREIKGWTREKKLHLIQG